MSKPGASGAREREVMLLPIGDIAIGERIGYFHADHAAWLASRFVAEGQSDPIHVRRNGGRAPRPWTLVAGLHRLRAAELAQLTTIDAIQVADDTSTPAELRRLELSENLDHRQPRPIERAIFMVARAGLEEETDHPGRVGEPSQARAGRARHSASLTVRDADNWRTRTAVAMGCSVKSLERYQRVHRAIVEALPDLAQALNSHALGESLSAMTRLATLKHDSARRQVVELILADPDMPSIDAALVAANISTSKGNRPAADDFESRFLRNWDRMKASQRRSAAVEVATMVSASIADDMIAAFRQRGLLP